VNHYERLKVSQDAPAEVIRAAYRALAAKLHPDRQGAETGPEDSMHAQMAALNAAYEVLIDPKTRREYDATLAPARPHVALAEEADLAQAASAASTKVEMEWLAPKPVATPMWPPNKRLMILGGGGLAVVILVMASVIWKVVGQHQMERALSDQYATHPVDGQVAQSVEGPSGLPPSADGASAGGVNAPVQRAAHRKPTVEELSRMSDEELVKVLPTLDDDTADALPPATMSRIRQSGGGAPHPLDGTPLKLRVDPQLIDPLTADSQTPRR
jgi:hypothetical protein